VYHTLSSFSNTSPSTTTVLAPKRARYAPVTGTSPQFRHTTCSSVRIALQELHKSRWKGIPHAILALPQIPAVAGNRQPYPRLPHRAESTASDPATRNDLLCKSWVRSFSLPRIAPTTRLRGFGILGLGVDLASVTHVKASCASSTSLCLALHRTAAQCRSCVLCPKRCPRPEHLHAHWAPPCVLRSTAQRPDVGLTSCIPSAARTLGIFVRLEQLLVSCAPPHSGPMSDLRPVPKRCPRPEHLRAP
jgi:hypothetical protein